MNWRKALDAVRTAVQVVFRSRFGDFLALVPALILASYWFGLQGASVIAMAGIPIAFLSRARDLLRAEARPDNRVDDLTGLPSRTAVIAAMDRAFEAARLFARSSACLIISIDEPHGILDNFGQAAHDKVLRKSGERIAGLLRENDVIARIEGARFALALAPARRADLEAVIQIAIRLKAALTEPLSVDAMTIYVSASVGFCLTSRAPEPTGVSILAAAELAHEDARRSGHGSIRAYSRDIEHAATLRCDLRDRVEAALDSGEIIAYFQPQLSTDTGEVTGFESLARWNHPERGILAPAEFLPTIISSGLSDRLGEVMLVHALSALRDWDKGGFRVPSVAVNFSKEELRSPTLVAKLKWELDRFDIAPTRLTVEVLESVVAETDNDMIVQNISALSKLGCRIDLDDFGTGHASIANIRRFAVDRIKIDRTFVTRVDADQSQQQIVAAVLSMAERLGLETLAEGVESIGEHAHLSQLGCTHVQGYAIARPMAFDATVEWLTKHNGKLSKKPGLSRRIG